MGGAGALLQFINRELKPWVVDRYDIDRDNATYFGHSFGGLFGTYVLLTAPAAFRRYIIGSPSLWWDHGVMFGYGARSVEPFGRRSQFATRSAGDEASSGRGAGSGRIEGGDPGVVYLGVGAYETHEGRQREAGQHAGRTSAPRAVLATSTWSPTRSGWRSSFAGLTG